MTIPDAEAQRRLNQALRDNLGSTDGPAAWVRLGELLLARRQVLGYDNRRQFVRERGEPLGVNEKLVYDLEGGPRWGRKGFSAGKLRAVAEAYAVTLDSIADALGGGDLVPEAGAPLPAALPPAPPDSAVTAFGADAIARAQPYANEITRRWREWTAEYAAANPDIAPRDIPLPLGDDLFPDSPHDAHSWDHHAADLDPDELVWLIARLQARQAAVRERESGAG